MSPYRGSGKVQRPDVLVCAGLDPSGGAGLLADVRVIDDLGARPVGVVTALTVQNTTGVISSQVCDPEVVGHQLTFLLTDVEVRAVKIGMIGSTEIAKAIANALHLTNAPVIWDPVAAPSRGDVTYIPAFDDAVHALRPHLTLITPNARELAMLTAMPVTNLAEAELAGQALAMRLDASVLVKGGHLGAEMERGGLGPTRGVDASIDLLFHAGGRTEFRAPRVSEGEHVHGTGCALSSAIAAYLATGGELVEACRLAKEYVLERIAVPVRPGRGAPAIV